MLNRHGNCGFRGSSIHRACTSPQSRPLGQVGSRRGSCIDIVQQNQCNSRRDGRSRGRTGKAYQAGSSSSGQSSCRARPWRLWAGPGRRHPFAQWRQRFPQQRRPGRRRPRRAIRRVFRRPGPMAPLGGRIRRPHRRRPSGRRKTPAGHLAADWTSLRVPYRPQLKWSQSPQPSLRAGTRAVNRRIHRQFKLICLPHAPGQPLGNGPNRSAMVSTASSNGGKASTSPSLNEPR